MKLLTLDELTKLVNDISLTYFDKPFNHIVTFNHRLRTTGGRYIPVKKTIELNPKYALEAEQDEFIGIIKHELCHYHLHIAGKGYKHRDKEFRELLRATGSPRHCKPLPSEQNRYNHIYKCKSCYHIYKRIRRVDVKKYRCGICKGRLVKIE